MKQLGVILFGTVLVAACGAEDGEAGEGTLRITVYGEDFIEKGIPASAMNDGWAVSFSKFEVELEDIAVSGLSLAGPKAFELAKDTGGSGQEVLAGTVAAGQHEGGSYTIGKVVVEGTATKGATTKTFA